MAEGVQVDTVSAESMERLLSGYVSGLALTAEPVKADAEAIGHPANNAKLRDQVELTVTRWHRGLEAVEADGTAVCARLTALAERFRDLDFELAAGVSGGGGM